jgi:hypothetical protein
VRSNGSLVLEWASPFLYILAFRLRLPTILLYASILNYGTGKGSYRE